MEAVNIQAARAGRPDDEAEALALRARTDPAAFGELYERYRESVFRYLRARTYTDEAALEISAATFERAFRSMPGYRTRGGGVLAWLFRIARNAAADEARRRSRSEARAAPQPPVSVSSPEQLVVRAEGRGELLRLVARLPEPQRDALALRYGARLTAREIGGVINKSEEATQKLISRALARLREELREG